MIVIVAAVVGGGGGAAVVAAAGVLSQPSPRNPAAHSPAYAVQAASGDLSTIVI